MSSQKIINKIIEAEQKAGVFNLKHKNKNLVWPFYRMYFYYKYLQTIAKVDELGASSFELNFKQLKKFFKLLLNSNLLKLLGDKKKILIISSQRYLEGKEIYTGVLKDSLNDNYLELSLSVRFEFTKGPVYLDLFKVIFKILSKIFYRFIKTPNEVTLFFHTVGAKNNFNKHYLQYRFEYSCWYNFYSLLLKFHKPKKVFYVGGVYFSPLVAAAEELEIETFEIQHGIINKFHLSYHFPNIHRSTFFPNTLLLFSQYWSDKAIFPRDVELLFLGNNYFFKKNTMKKPKTLLIVGQGIYYSKLIAFIKQNLSLFNRERFLITYKLHPREIQNWQNRYLDLYQLSLNKEIKVVTYEKSITELLSEHESVIGISSTVIYEAIDSGCKAYILNVQSSEYFSDLEVKGYVKKLNYQKPLRKIDFEFTPRKREKFFNPINQSLVERLIYH